MLRLMAFAMCAGVISANPQLYQDTTTWTGKCASGMMQSPIDLPTNMTAVIHAPITFRNYFNGHFNKHFTGAMINNGITIVWTINPKRHNALIGGKLWKWKNPSIRNGPFGGLTHSHAYYFWRIEFHWGEPGKANKGSEHTIDGEMSALEMQFIHVEDRYIGPDGEVMWKKAQNAKLGIAILSILFYVDDKKPQNNQALSKIDDKVWEMHWAGPKKRRSIDVSMDLDEAAEIQLQYDDEMNINNLLNAFREMKSDDNAIAIRADKPWWKRVGIAIGAWFRRTCYKINQWWRRRWPPIDSPFPPFRREIRSRAAKPMSTYFSYQGSLTTPSCKEAVTWVVFRTRLPIAQVQANAFSSLYRNNFRPSRPAAPEHELKHLIQDCVDCTCHCKA